MTEQEEHEDAMAWARFLMEGGREFDFLRELNRARSEGTAKVAALEKDKDRLFLDNIDWEDTCKRLERELAEVRDELLKDSTPGKRLFFDRIMEERNEARAELARMKPELERLRAGLNVARKYLLKHSHGPEGQSCEGCTALGVIDDALEAQP